MERARGWIRDREQSVFLVSLSVLFGGLMLISLWQVSLAQASRAS